MTVPDFQSLMLPVLRAMANGEVSAVDLRRRVASELGLTEDDLAQMLPSGRQPTFHNRVAWLNIFLQRAGLVHKIRRGVYQLSPEGQRVVAAQPQRIDMRFLERYPAFCNWPPVVNPFLRFAGRRGLASVRGRRPGEDGAAT